MAIWSGMKRMVLGLAVVTIGAVGCTETASVGERDVSVRRDTGGRDRDAEPAEDILEDTETLQDATDAADGSGAEPDAGSGEDASGEDVSTDAEWNPVADDCEVTPGECNPRTLACADDRLSVIVCGRCGQKIREDRCGDGELCFTEAGRAECRACSGPDCEQLPEECEPNTVLCTDYQTAARCDQFGQIGSPQRCPASSICVNGACRGGSETAAFCERNQDCRGSLCVCGSEYTTQTGGLFCDNTIGAFSSGYCTTGGCQTLLCDYDKEVCADLIGHNRGRSLDFCVTKEGCSIPGRACGKYPGYVCTEIPVRYQSERPLEWELACWPDRFRRIGDTCTGDADCIGGRCLSKQISGNTVKYCSAKCTAKETCPDYAECVQIDRGSSDFFCLAKANPVDCPRLESEPWNIVEKNNFRPLVGATAPLVCYLF